jgi:hypothetical protein
VKPSSRSSQGGEVVGELREGEVVVLREGERGDGVKKELMGEEGWEEKSGTKGGRRRGGGTGMQGRPRGDGVKEEEEEEEEGEEVKEEMEERSSSPGNATAAALGVAGAGVDGTLPATALPPVTIFAASCSDSPPTPAA